MIAVGFKLALVAEVHDRSPPRSQQMLGDGSDDGFLMPGVDNDRALARCAPLELAEAKS